MNKLAASLPLQNMLESVLRDATEKLAQEETNQKGSSEEKKSPFPPKEKAKEDEKKKSEETKTAAMYDFVEKLAAACDYIAENIHNIQPTGLLQQAINKMAEGAEGFAGPLPVSAAIGGQQSHKKDKCVGEDASKPTTSTPLSSAGLPGGSTQMENDRHSAPGQNSGAVPTAKYPDKGVTANIGSTKTAEGVKALYKQAMSHRVHKLSGQTKCAMCDKEACICPKKTASQIAKEAILRKLAGEDYSTASVSGGGTTSPLAGQGQLASAIQGQALPRQAGGPTGGFGNQGRSLISGNSAAIGYTKKDAKGPQKTQLKNLLTEPMQSSKTDSVIKNNLRNTGSEKIAGVKIAAGTLKNALLKIATEGCSCESSGECQNCRLKEVLKDKTKEAEDAQTLAAAANSAEGGGHSGCTCGGKGECRVCRLKAALLKAKGDGEKQSQMGGMIGANNPPPITPTMGM